MSDNVILLAGLPYRLKWDRSAMFYADEVGAFAPGSRGFSRACKMVWAMMPEEGRAKYPKPSDVANVLPPLTEANAKISAAYEIAGESMDPKKVFGSTTGPSSSPSS